MANPGDLTIDCGEDWVATMTYKRAGVPTRVDNPEAEIRHGSTSQTELVLRMDSTGTSPIITQQADGVLAFHIPYAITQTLPPGQWYWDLFGVVAGNRIKLVPTSAVSIVASVTAGD